MKGKQLLSILVLSVFIVATLSGITSLATPVNDAKDIVFNFWINSSGVSSEGGSAKYVSIDGPIGYTAGYLLTQTYGQSGYVILDNSITATYGVYTIQAVMVNASSPPADEIALARSFITGKLRWRSMA